MEDVALGEDLIAERFDEFPAEPLRLHITHTGDVETAFHARAHLGRVLVGPRPQPLGVDIRHLDLEYDVAEVAQDFLIGNIDIDDRRAERAVDVKRRRGGTAHRRRGIVIEIARRDANPQTLDVRLIEGGLIAGTGSSAAEGSSGSAPATMPNIRAQSFTVRVIGPALSRE